MNINFELSELTKEKHLYDIFKESLSIKFSRFNKICTFLIVCLLFTRAYIFEPDVQILLAEVREWVTIGFESSLSILGFLLAGFTIFATLSKPTMLVEMMNHKHENSNLPYLKYNYFVFMRVFVFYIFFSCIYLLIILFCGNDGLYESLIYKLPIYEDVKCNSIKLANILVGSSFVFLLLQLKTFIFNIYSIVMTSLRWECFDDLNNPKDSAHENELQITHSIKVEKTK